MSETCKNPEADDGVATPLPSEPPIPPENIQSAGTETMQDREALYRLVQNDRINSEAGMPAANHMALSQRCRDRIDKEHLSIHKAARQVGCSTATLSEWMRDKYRGDNEAIDAKVARWLNNFAIREEGRRLKDYVETRIAEEMRSIIRMGYRHNCMVCIVAPSGCGKSFVTKAMCAELNGIYVVVNHTVTPREFLTQLAIAVGWPDAKRSAKAELHRFIVNALKGTNRPVFVDESHILGRSINFVRGIHDEAETPIILIGTAEILTFIDDRGHGSGQFASRTIYYNALEKARGMGTPGDGPGAAKQCLFSIEEVKSFYASREIKLDKDALKLAFELANLPGFGSLRLVERAAAVVLDLDADVEIISRDQLVMALRLLHSADFDRMELMVCQAEEKPKVARVA